MHKSHLFYKEKPFLSIYAAIDLLPSIRENTLNKFTIFKIITINSKILVNLNNFKQITIRKIVIDKQHEAILWLFLWCHIFISCHIIHL